MSIKAVTYTKDYKLSSHFALSEFKCKSGSKTVKYSEETIALLEKIFETCANVGKAIITSGYRTPDYSVKVGGSRTDGHTVGIAVDVKWYDKNNNLIAPKYIACVAQDIGFTGIGIMSNSIHLDTRTTANYKNGKWWGDETNGKSGITDFYAYCNLSRSEVDKVLGRQTKASPSPDRTAELEVEIEKLKAEVNSLKNTNKTLEEEATKYKAVIENIKKLLKEV